MKVKTTPGALDPVRCPYCVDGQNFRRMAARENSRFICGRCGHIESPNVEFECNCGKCAELRKYNPEITSVCWQIDDAVGYPCGQDISARCSDCDTPICDNHGETCAGCGAVFCATCLAFHNSEQPEHRRRRSA